MRQSNRFVHRTQYCLCIQLDVPSGTECDRKLRSHADASSGYSPARYRSSTIMIWQSAISSNVILLVLMILAPQRSLGGAAGGQVRLVASSDAGTQRKNNYSGVVVWLSSHGKIAAHSRAKHAEMLQKDKRFSPHILAIETGTIVDFPASRSHLP